MTRSMRHNLLRERTIQSAGLGRPEAIGTEAMGTVDVALANATRLLTRDPRLAAMQAREILTALPAHSEARLLLGRAERLCGCLQAALEVLAPLGRELPEVATVQLELGIALGEVGREREAVAALRQAARAQPDLPDAWRLLADQLDLRGDSQGADEARARHLKAASKDPLLMEAAAALVANHLPAAETILRAHLKAAPTDIAALRMLSEVAGRLRRYTDAQVLLERCLTLAPSFDAARHNYAVILNRQGKAAALPQIDRLLVKDPRNPGYRNLKAAILANLGDFAESIEVYAAVLKDYPRQPKIWMSYGHSLKTDGRQRDSIAAYRRAIAMEPTLGEAYWSLANLKTFRFSAEDVLALRAALRRDDLTDDDRLHFEFSLGKALEDQGEYPQSFDHYAHGNAIRRKLQPYVADDTTQFVRRSKAVFTADFLAARKGSGSPDRAPIFIVGLPRAGSTLIEQILASHSSVEGTMELPDIPRMAADIIRGHASDGSMGFAQALEALTQTQLRDLGERYLADTRSRRKTDKPFFIDKMPNNCLYVGFIHLILPNAKIIDARRHPLGCCVSAFKQHFARGQSFSYDQSDLGRYYCDYVELMAHIDTVLPGRIHRVFYESMIEDTEGEIHRLLDYCALPFEAQCLRFYENERAVRTASSEQVRRPIFKDAMDHWRHYVPWLGPLKQTLGSIVERYPALPGEHLN